MNSRERLTPQDRAFLRSLKVSTAEPELMPLSEYDELMAKYEAAVIEIVQLRTDLEAADSEGEEAEERARRSDDRVYGLCVAVLVLALVAALGWMRSF